MSHYFITPEQTGPLHRVHAEIWGRDYEFWSAPGVFSANRLDIGTSVLLNKGPIPDAGLTGRVLDLGCGFGAISCALAKHCTNLQVDAVDVNKLALELTRRNADELGVGDRVRVGLAEDFKNMRYEQIWSNPPIRIGKTELHGLLLHWLSKLVDGGQAWLVVGKNLGADSLQRWLIDQGWATEKYASAKGFRVLHIEN